MLDPKPTFWQVSAGRAGRDYSDIFLAHDVMFIGPGDRGVYDSKTYADSPSLQLFHDAVKPGDIVLMRRGDRVIAVGRVQLQDYYHIPAFDDIFGWDLQHTRRVLWEKLGKPRSLFNSPRMARFSRIQDIPADLQKHIAKAKLREHHPLPDAPSACLSPEEFRSHLEKELPDGARVYHLLERHRDLLRWYRQDKALLPNEHEIVAYLVVPLLRALGWSEKQLALEWGLGKYKDSTGKKGRADLAAFAQPSRAREHCVMLVEAKALNFGLGSTLPQPKRHALDLPSCRRIVTTQGSRFGIYLRNADGTWPDIPNHYLNIERPRLKHAFPRGTNSVAALVALRP